MVTHKLHTLVYQLDKYANIFLVENYSITYTHFLTMLCIFHSEYSTQKDLSQSTGLSKGMISRIISDLELKKFIKVKNPDKRTNLISLTKKGAEIVEEASSDLEKAFVTDIAFKDKKLISNLEKILDTLHSNINGK